jgi:rhodanese-related sulfurtransferase
MPDILQKQLTSPKPLLLIDIGERPGFDKMHIDKARLIPAHELVKQTFPPELDIVLYDSRLGTRATRNAAAALIAAGNNKVAILKNGLSSWLKAGLPLQGGIPGLDEGLGDTAIPLDVLANAIQDQDEFQLLDIRDAVSYAQGTITNAVHVVSPDVVSPNVGQAWSNWDKNKWVVVLDDGRGAARETVRQLRAAGFRLSAYLKGGYPAWMSTKAASK